MKSLLTPQLLDDLFGWLAERAGAGRVCPGNAEIARRYEFASAATAAKAVGRLEKQGRIAVRRGWTARQATIIATGESTAPIAQVNRRPPRPRVGPVTAATGPRIVGPKGRRCQWIAGEPSGDDSCKCLRETARGASWCTDHLERIYLPAEATEERFGSLPGIVRGTVAGRAAG